jgi:DNA-binding SARP family transcriptional activator
LLGTLADVANSLVTALLIFGAIPAVLVTVVGDPLRGGLGHQWSHIARDATGVLAVVAWVAWIACCAQLTRSVIDHVRRGHVHIPAGSPFSEKVAARIAAGVLTLSALVGPMVLSNVSGAAVPSQLRTVTVTTTAAAVPPAPSDSTIQPVAPVSDRYQVQAGDSLWSIAQDHLGDGADWTAIAALNLGQTMSGGRRFVDPSVIEPGWELQLPTAPSAPFVTTVGPTTPAPVSTSTSAPSPAPTLRPVTIPTALTAHLTVASTHAEEATHTPEQRSPAGSSTSTLPELAIIGLGALGCAALARRSRRRYLRRGAVAPGPHDEFDRPPALVDTETLVGRFAGVPALEAFESANALLQETLQHEVLVPSQRVQAICVGSAGVDFWWKQATGGAPAPFTVLAGGAAWRINHDAIAAQQPTTGRPLLAVALVIGDDEDGTWLVPVQPGTCLPIFGEAADGLWRSALATQTLWAWADEVFIADDPATVEREARLTGPAASVPADAPQILFFGDPSLLAPDLRPRVAIVTTVPAPASDLAVLVDHRAATIHPLGRTVRPHFIRADASSLVAELAASANAPVNDYVAPPAVRPEPPSLLDECAVPTPVAVPVRPAPEQPIREPLLLPAPGFVEVKLLTMTPRLEGLRDELPPNRARRAVELVAYLALHQPDAVTSDRLRTRVLGSADADAASKTLFNTAAAARRSMGTNALGQPLFPPASRAGQYRVTEEVTVDIHRAAQLAEIGNATEDPEVAISVLRSALSLIEGEPLANALSGFTWWEAEGHGGRIAAVLVNAACNLAALAVDAALFDVAQWGLEKARLVDPYSESLSRAAMQVAAAAGDADRLRREWRECQRRVDELDPGSAPSPRTERLYGELAQRVLVGTPG